MIPSSKLLLRLCLLTVAGHSIAMQKPAAINNTASNSPLISILEQLSHALQTVEPMIAHLRTTSTSDPAQLATLITNLSHFSGQLTNDTPRIRQLLLNLIQNAQALQTATNPTPAQMMAVVTTYQSLAQIIANRLPSLKSAQVSIQMAPTQQSNISPMNAPIATNAATVQLLNQTLQNLDPIFTHMQQTNTPSQNPQFAIQLKTLRSLEVPSSFPRIKEQLAELIALCDNLSDSSVAECCNTYRNLKILLQARARAFLTRMPQQQPTATPVANTASAAAHNAISIALPTNTQAPISNAIECSICSDEKSPEEFSTLSCGHRYCTACLTTIADGALRERQSVSLKCPDPSCKRPIEQNDLIKILAENDKVTAIQDIQLQEWLTAQHGTAKQCPTPNCPFQFTNERDYQFTMKCPRCQEQYCGSCLHAHGPLTSCQEAEEARRLANDTNAQNSASERWMQENTRPCPQCNTRIEKTEGCNHMTCRNCRHEFCWVCLANWRNHGGSYYTCQFNPTSTANADANNHRAAPAPQQPRQEITYQNEHVLFARDPIGFENNLSRWLRDANFIERFMRLTCAQQEEWLLQVSVLLVSRLGSIQVQNVEIRHRIWLEVLQQVEQGVFIREIANLAPYPFTRHTRHLYLYFNPVGYNQLYPSSILFAERFGALAPEEQREWVIYIMRHVDPIRHNEQEITRIWLEELVRIEQRHNNENWQRLRITPGSLHRFNVHLALTLEHLYANVRNMLSETLIRRLFIERFFALTPAQQQEWMHTISRAQINNEVNIDNSEARADLWLRTLEQIEPRNTTQNRRRLTLLPGMTIHAGNAHLALLTNRSFNLNQVSLHALENRLFSERFLLLTPDQQHEWAQAISAEQIHNGWNIYHNEARTESWLRNLERFEQRNIHTLLRVTDSMIMTGSNMQLFLQANPQQEFQLPSSLQNVLFLERFRELTAAQQQEWAQAVTRNQIIDALGSWHERATLWLEQLERVETTRPAYLEQLATTPLRAELNKFYKKNNQAILIFNTDNQQLINSYMNQLVRRVPTISEIVIAGNRVTCLTGSTSRKTVKAVLGDINVMRSHR